MAKLKKRPFHQLFRFLPSSLDLLLIKNIRGKPLNILFRVFCNINPIFSVNPLIHYFEHLTTMFSFQKQKKPTEHFNMTYTTFHCQFTTERISIPPNSMLRANTIFYLYPCSAASISSFQNIPGWKEKNIFYYKNNRVNIF